MILFSAMNGIISATAMGVADREVESLSDTHKLIFTLSIDCMKLSKCFVTVLQLSQQLCPSVLIVPSHLVSFQGGASRMSSE